MAKAYGNIALGENVAQPGDPLVSPDGNTTVSANNDGTASITAPSNGLLPPVVVFTGFSASTQHYSCGPWTGSFSMKGPFVVDLWGLAPNSIVYVHETDPDPVAGDVYEIPSGSFCIAKMDGSDDWYFINDQVGDVFEITDFDTSTPVFSTASGVTTTGTASITRGYASKKLATEDQLLALCDIVYPVGSIYTSVNSTSPAALFGGTWERITGCFLLAATDGGAAGGNGNASIAPGNTGGEAAHKLTNSELPKLSGTFEGANNIAVNNSTSTTRGFPTIYAGSGIVSSSDVNADQVQVNSGCHTVKKDMTYTRKATISIGNDGSHNNMPPYLAVYVWKRTA